MNTGGRFQLTAKTLSGLEQPLANELNALGAEDIAIGVRAVEFTGGLRMVYMANLWSRCAIRILVKITDFPAEDEHELYNNALKFQWEDYFGIDETFAIDAVTVRSNITHSLYAAQKVKDAIADRFRKHFNNKRPSVDVANPDIRINIHISSNVCTISFDSSGDSLHRRGYRQNMHAAPMSEVLAAGLIALSDWDKTTPLLDPMCGSGTFLTEAALIATNTAPGLFRNKFGFESWKNFNKQLWLDMKEEAKAAVQPLTVEISGSDNSNVSLALAEENVEALGFKDQIILKRQSFERVQAPGKPMFLVMNPPYGERLRPDQLIGMYAMIGNKLKHDFAGSEAWIISSNFEAFKNVGLKPSKKYVVFNGPLECRFVGYKMFKGTLVEHKYGSS